MSISPFSAHPASPEGESRRARLALIIATVGIAATLVAYAVSPGVRHAVGHAAHSVKHAVSRVFDHDTGAAHRGKPKAAKLRAKRATHPAPKTRKRSAHATHAHAHAARSANGAKGPADGATAPANTQAGGKAKASGATQG